MERSYSVLRRPNYVKWVISLWFFGGNFDLTLGPFLEIWSHLFTNRQTIYLHVIAQTILLGLMMYIYKYNQWPWI